MANVMQVYTILNEVASQSMGEKAISVVDANSFVALGNEVLSSDVNTENFMNTLVDRIGRTIFSIRNYSGVDETVIRHPFEFGCILQKIYVDLPKAKPNNSWEIGKESYKPEFAPVIKPTVKQKLFNKITTWEVDVTIPDFMLRTAFTSSEQMGAFISAIFVAMDNRMEQALENSIDVTRCSFIARKINGGKSCGAINLLKDYNTLTNAGLTVASALRNTDFLKWASAEIGKWATRMARMSVLFNEENYQRHTPKENLVINVLQDFASATNAFLQSDTYHNTLTALPKYKEVPYWQGSGETYAFNDTSAIDIQLSEEVTVKKSGIIAIMFDEQALGVTINERRSTTERNNKDEYTDYFNKANIGYFNDMSENGIVFYLEEV